MNNFINKLIKRYWFKPFYLKAPPKRIYLENGDIGFGRKLFVDFDHHGSYKSCFIWIVNADQIIHIGETKRSVWVALGKATGANFKFNFSMWAENKQAYAQEKHPEEFEPWAKAIWDQAAEFLQKAVILEKEKEDLQELSRGVKERQAQVAALRTLKGNDLRSIK